MALTVWDDDKDEMSNGDFEMVDEFIFNITTPAGLPRQTLRLDGDRPAFKSRYII